MRRRIAMLAAVAAVSGVITIFAPTTAANAVPHEVCAGALGTATISSPFVYPVVGQTDGNTAPPFQVTVSPHSATFGVTFGATGACVPSLTGFGANGTVHGWCGLSVGSGTTTKGDPFHWVGVGSLLVVTGGIIGVVNATPNVVAGESCITGADSFLVQGAAVRNSCSLVNLQSVPVASVSIPATNQHPVPGVLSVTTHGHLSATATVCA